MAGFRKSLFGFNCEDVMSYIERSQNSFAKKEKDLSEKLNQLNNELDLSNENYNKLNAEKEAIAKKLSDFSEKYEEIERLSENIGKLYLVAQANAQAIMENSENSLKLADAEIEKNLSTIEEAHTSLDELKQNILKTSSDFVNELDGLINSLVETKNNISENTTSGIEYKNQFDEVYKAITE